MPSFIGSGATVDRWRWRFGQLNSCQNESSSDLSPRTRAQSNPERPRGSPEGRRKRKKAKHQPRSQVSAETDVAKGGKGRRRKELRLTEALIA
ncbi:hypothetical protein PYCCODRAFT_1222576 [Trametes coccinea BRFM310]|uniref:Uncharacterized protein n=1 Tax=Trametes coccinea (strain BRFM310) TaxID=1353009 RepID=A0A1Y2IXG2_TRAC3|nr:hypothetical protein PYCCODRAFT_1222576 [Trametes coccinea BRFM310]